MNISFKSFQSLTESNYQWKFYCHKPYLPMRGHQNDNRVMNQGYTKYAEEFYVNWLEAILEVSSEPYNAQ